MGQLAPLDEFCFAPPMGSDRPTAKDVPLRVLTVRQPWASAIVYGPKRIENRGRPLPSTMLGTSQARRAFWVAISASAAFDVGAQSTVDAWRSPVPDDDVLLDTSGAWPNAPSSVRNEADYPRAAILGFVRIIGQIAVPEPPPAPPRQHADYSALKRLRAKHRGGLWLCGPFGYVIDPTVLRLPAPIPWVGALGFQMATPALQTVFDEALTGDRHVEINDADADPRES